MVRASLAVLLLATCTLAATAEEVEFPRCAPHEVGIHTKRLREMSEWVRAEELDVRAMIIVRNGRLALEWYAADVTRDHNHNVFSVTKSVVATLVGVAIEQKRLPGIETKLERLLPEQPQLRSDSVKKEISLAQLLTMQSGFPVTRGNLPKEHPKRALFDRIHTADQRCETILGLPLEEVPGTRFAYNNNDPQLVASILERAYGMDVLSLGKQQLFDRLGFANVQWLFPDTIGSYPGGYGLRLRAIDMAKLGQLYLNQGTWQDDRILSKRWCQEATADQTGTGYGYYWWTEVGACDGDHPFSAKGVRGQRIFVDPSSKLVFVIVADLPPEKVRQVTSTLIDEYVRPAVVQNTPLPENQTELKLLQKELALAKQYRPSHRDNLPKVRLPQAP
ncbi:serine hydrolase [Bremerella sp. JC770]|uniref:serine hydrolase domain-containing protein n=1 Tax=Bremerella sp. JC770 TaxID=3232137 RepID=UPI0034586421